MSRLLSARGVAVTVVALAAVIAMVMLGLWQLGVYDDHQDDDARAALERPPVPLDAVLGPDEGLTSSDVGRPIEVSGSYDPGGQFYVRGLAGAAGDAVATPLVTADGPAVLVIRGLVDAGGSTAPPPGQVVVTGVLEPSDSGAAALDDQRTTNGVNIAVLVSSVDHDLYAGYVIATASVPADDLRALAPPPANPSRWAGIRNLLYAFQWWLFACFAIFMWWRILNEDRDSAPGGVATRG